MLRSFLSGCLGQGDKPKEAPLVATLDSHCRLKSRPLTKKGWHKQGVHGPYADAFSLLPDSDESALLGDAHDHDSYEEEAQYAKQKQQPCRATAPTARTYSASWSMDMEGSSSVAEGSMSFANACHPFVHRLDGPISDARLRVYANPLSECSAEDSEALECNEADQHGVQAHIVRPQGKSSEHLLSCHNLHYPTQTGLEDPLDAALADVINEANMDGLASHAGKCVRERGGSMASDLGGSAAPLMPPFQPAPSYPDTPADLLAAGNDDQAFAASLLDQLQCLLEEVAADTAAAAQAAAAAARSTRAAAGSTTPRSDALPADRAGSMWAMPSDHTPSPSCPTPCGTPLPPYHPCSHSTLGTPTGSPMIIPSPPRPGTPTPGAMNPPAYCAPPVPAWGPTHIPPPWLLGWDPHAAFLSPPPLLGAAAPRQPAAHLAAAQAPPAVTHASSPDVAPPVLAPPTVLAASAPPPLTPSQERTSTAADTGCSHCGGAVLRDSCVGLHVLPPPLHSSLAFPYPGAPPGAPLYYAPPGHAFYPHSHGYLSPLLSTVPAVPPYMYAPSASSAFHQPASFHRPTPMLSSPAPPHTGNLSSLQPPHSFSYAPSSFYPQSSTTHHSSTAFVPRGGTPTDHASKRAAAKPSFPPPAVDLPPTPPSVEPPALEPLLSPRPSTVLEQAPSCPAHCDLPQSNLPAPLTAHSLPPALAPISLPPLCEPEQHQTHPLSGTGDPNTIEGPGTIVETHAQAQSGLHGTSPTRVQSSSREAGPQCQQHSPGSGCGHAPSKRSSRSQGTGYVSPALLSLNSKLDSLSGMAGGMADKLAHLAGVASLRPRTSTNASLSTLSSIGSHARTHQDPQGTCVEEGQLLQNPRGGSADSMAKSSASQNSSEPQSFLELTVAHARRIRELSTS